MRVLLQEWIIGGKHRLSVSLSEAQLNATLAIYKEQGLGQPEGKAHVVEIPDDHEVSYAVEKDTAFLETSEEKIITYPDGK